jgi:hypothetical protein
LVWGAKQANQILTTPTKQNKKNIAVNINFEDEEMTDPNQNSRRCVT